MECQPVSQIKPLEQIAELAPSIGQEGMYQTIDMYAAGTTALYTPGMPLPIHRSMHINKPYGQHENKLINNSGITTVYSNFKPTEVTLNVFHNNLGVSHKEKNEIIDVNIPYNLIK